MDEEAGVLYAALGSPADDFWGGERLGNNLYGNSLVAIDASTGKLLWHFQTVHHDMWDADFSAQPILLTVKRGGKPVKAVAATNKAGFIFLFERATGKPLFDIKEVPQPPSDAPAMPTRPGARCSSRWTTAAAPVCSCSPPTEPTPSSRRRSCSCWPP